MANTFWHDFRLDTPGTTASPPSPLVESNESGADASFTVTTVSDIQGMSIDGISAGSGAAYRVLAPTGAGGITPIYSSNGDTVEVLGLIKIDSSATQQRHLRLCPVCPSSMGVNPTVGVGWYRPTTSGTWRLGLTNGTVADTGVNGFYLDNNVPPSGWVYLRVRFTRGSLAGNANVKFRYWNLGSTEPSTWAFDFTGTPTTTQVADQVGFGLYETAAAPLSEYIAYFSAATGGLSAPKPPVYLDLEATERNDSGDVNLKRLLPTTLDGTETGDLGQFYLKPPNWEIKIFSATEGRDTGNIQLKEKIFLPTNSLVLPFGLTTSGKILDGFRLVRTGLPNTLRIAGLVNEQFHGTASLPNTLAVISDIILRPTVSGTVSLPFTLQTDALAYVVSSITSTGVDAFEIVLTGSMVQGSTQVTSPTADVDYPFIDGNTYLVVNLRTKSHTTYKDGSNDALAKTGLLTLGTNQMKNISDAYLLSRSTTDVEFIAKNDEITERNYAVTYADYGQFNLSNKKIRLAKGLRGQEWQISIVSLGDDYAEVREVEMIVNQLQRRI